MTDQPPICPTCLRSDHAYKVNRLYIEGVALINRKTLESHLELHRLLADILPAGTSAFDQNQIVSRMVKAFTPPSSPRKLLKHIHPDWMAIFFCFAALFFFYKITSTRPALLPVFISLFIAGLLVYVLLRKSAVQKFQMQILHNKEDNIQVEKHISRWMRLYYCSRDQCVFDTEEKRSVPVENIKFLWD